MHPRIRIAAASLVTAGFLITMLLSAPVSAQTPAPGCGQPVTPVASPGTMHQGMDSGMMHEVEFDQMYIDMMIPHHASVLALAEVALPDLQDPRLQAIARNILDTQAGEIEHLRQLRTEWYGSPDIVPMDEASMAMMMDAMPGLGSAEDQMRMMSAEWQVATFCAADNADLAFIDQVIPHHQMAIDASKIALTSAVHPELVTIAQQVIADQQREIDELQAIRAELTGVATPAA